MLLLIVSILLPIAIAIRELLEEGIKRFACSKCFILGNREKSRRMMVNKLLHKQGRFTTIGKNESTTLDTSHNHREHCVQMLIFVRKNEGTMEYQQMQIVLLSLENAFFVFFPNPLPKARCCLYNLAMND